MAKYSFFQEMAELKKFISHTMKKGRKDKIGATNTDLPNNQEERDIKKNKIDKTRLFKLQQKFAN